MAKQDRSNTYLMKRLEDEHPAVFADWQAGKYTSKRQALIAAGLRHPQKHINALKNAWAKASPAEQASFLTWIGAPTPTSPLATKGSASAGSLPVNSLVATATRLSHTPPPHSAILQPDRHLRPAVKSRIRSIMNTRGMRQCDALREMGYTKVHDTSLAMVLSDYNSRAVRPDLELALVKWLDANKGVS